MPSDILTDNPMRLIIENDLLRIMFRRAVVRILLSIGYSIIQVRQPHYNSDAIEIVAFSIKKSGHIKKKMFWTEQNRPELGFAKKNQILLYSPNCRKIKR
jgi:hypothetical protein